MKNIIALSPMYTEDSNNLKKASINSSYELNRFNAKWNVPEEFRKDVIAVYGEDIYAEIVAEQCNLTLTKPKDNWLAGISEEFTKRKISYGQLKDLYIKKIFSLNALILKVLKQEFSIKSRISKVLIL